MYHLFFKLIRMASNLQFNVIQSNIQGKIENKIKDFDWLLEIKW